MDKTLKFGIAVVAVVGTVVAGSFLYSLQWGLVASLAGGLLFSLVMVTFQIRHLFTNVNGRFDSFQGQIQFDPEKRGEVKVEGTIDTASINTNHEKRDQDLRSKRFFDVEEYPKITFVSTRVTDVDPAKQTGKLHGKFNMHGVERPVVLDVAYLGAGTDPWGNQRAGFMARTTINRKDYGLNWNETLDTGGLLLGEQVEIEINVEGMVEQ